MAATTNLLDLDPPALAAATPLNPRRAGINCAGSCRLKTVSRKFDCIRAAIPERESSATTRPRSITTTRAQVACTSGKM